LGHSIIRVLKPVVGALTVHMMQCHGERLTEPILNPTALAAVVLQPRGEQAALQVRAVHAPAAHEVLANRGGLRPRDQHPPSDRVHEGLPSEAEPLLALGDRVTLVVETLDRGPVIAPVAARVDRVTEPPLVVAHG